MLKHSLIVALGLALLSASLPAADYSMWGGTPNRNMVNPNEKGIPAEWNIEEGKNIKWKAELGSQSYGNPIVHKGKIFIGTNNGHPRDPKIEGDKGVMMAFAESDGKFLWQQVHDKLPSGRVNDWPEQGICSSPAVEGDRLYYVSNRCELVCLDTEGFLDNENDGDVKDEKGTGPENADVVWILDMMKELQVFPHNLANCSPLLVGDRIFAITSNGVDEAHIVIPQPKSASFVAVDKKTGKVLWTNNLSSNATLHGQWSNPSYGEVKGKGQVYFAGGDGWLYALSPDKGELIWKFDCNPKDAVYMLGPRGTRNHIIGTPVFFENKVYVGVGEDPEHGEGPGHFYCIDATKTGDVTESAKVWHFDAIKRTISTCSIKDGLLYISDLSGYLYCLELATGKLLWKHDVLAAVWSSPTLIDGKIYLGDEDGDVVVLAEGREEKVLGENTVENASYTTPVAANGVLYVANGSEMYAIKSK